MLASALLATITALCIISTNANVRLHAIPTYDFESSEAVSGIVRVNPVGPQYEFGDKFTKDEFAYGQIRAANDVSGVICSDIAHQRSRVLVKSEQWEAEPVTKIVWFENVTCSGDEEWVGDCEHTGLGVGDVDSGPVAGVTCFLGVEVTKTEERCDVGMFLDLGSHTCLNCTRGSFKPRPGNEACTLCPSGKYQESSGAPSCSSCPVNFHNPNVGSDSSFACGRCPELTGTFDSVGSDKCMETCWKMNAKGEEEAVSCENNYQLAVMAIFKVSDVERVMGVLISTDLTFVSVTPHDTP